MPASAFTMRGTLTLDDGRVATLKVRRFALVTSPNAAAMVARFRCEGDACFHGKGSLLRQAPMPSRFSATFGQGGNDDTVTCGTQVAETGRCRINQRVICRVPPYEEVAAGVLDLKGTSARCRRIIRRGGS